ncbi:thioesterase II family protein [Streptomyces sp. Ru72]|uniref:thioesterase II family protein n=1 Tax=Streptomyces sp. Ru72 TaxID=2080747 RepID=UPI0015E2C6E7|nr:thioesterase [Streptomyces sp. Ru72]
MSSGTGRADAADPQWTVRLRRADRPARRLLVFPHAGAGPDTYLRLLDDLPADVELLGVALPGREHRTAEPPGTTLTATVSGILGELRRREPLPTVYYGHSMGALLAVATARADPARCRALVLTAGVPGADALNLPVALDTPEGLELMFARHRVPMRALDSDLARTPEEYRLAHDLILAREALLAVGGLRLDCPITAIGGRDDQLAPAAAVPGWQRYTTGPFRHTTVKGAHFFPFLQTSGSAVLAAISEALEPAPLGAGAAPVSAVRTTPTGGIG